MSNQPEDTIKLKGNPPDLDRTAITPLEQLPRPQSPMAYIVHVHPRGPSFGLRHLVGPDPVLIGRSTSCDVVDTDPSVSRQHARVELRDDGRFQVTDMGSSNGTFVNHSRVAVAELHDGDIVRVGNSLYRFLTGGNLEAGYHEEIHRLAVTDQLTGLANRRALVEFLEREAERAKRHLRPLTVAMLDIDHFKQINDRYGYIAGDLALRGVAGSVRPLVRRDELLARVGGDEFAVVLPETGLEEATRCAERLRTAVEHCPFEVEGNRFRVTVSAGVGSSTGPASLSAADLIDLARDRLDEAKRSGRNQVRW